MVSALLLLVSVILFVLAAFSAVPHLALGLIGLAFLAAALLLDHLPARP